MVQTLSIIGAVFAVGGSYVAVDTLRDVLIAKAITMSYATRMAIASAAALGGFYVITNISAQAARKQTKQNLGKQLMAAEDEKCDLDYHLRCHECRLCLDCNPDADAAGNICRFCTGEEKLSKTSCCCGATESNPCVCMKAPEPMSCSAIEPKCACYNALEKNAESEDYGVEPRWM